MNVHPVDASPLSLDDLTNIACTAGKMIMDYFTPYKMERIVKSDSTPVTIADKAINSMVVQEIRAISETIDILGEEESSRTDSDWQVVCDPIDGTFPYTWGVPIATFMIALLYKGVPHTAVIYDPFTDRLCFSSVVIGKTYMLDEIIQVSTEHLATDWPVVGFVSWPGAPYNILKVCQYLEDRGVTMINMCSIGYIEVLVASGEFAGSIFPGTHYHDTAPGHLLVENAGGKATDLFGRPLDYSKGSIEGHIISNGYIHDLLVEAVKACN